MERSHNEFRTLETVDGVRETERAFTPSRFHTFRKKARSEEQSCCHAGVRSAFILSFILSYLEVRQQPNKTRSARRESGTSSF